MKTKKSNRANLENKRTLFIQIGFIFVLIMVLAAFEWNSKVEYKPITWTAPVIETIELDMPRTKQEGKKEVVKPPVPNLIVTKGEVEIKEEPFIFSTEDTWDAPIPEIAKTEEPEDVTEYPIVEIMPTFQGKDAVYFRNYVAENVIFPREASENGMGGKVYVSFVVGKDGYIHKVEILRGVNSAINEAVIKVIQNSPKWEPGVQSGRYVNVRFSIAVNFEIMN